MESFGLSTRHADIMTSSIASGGNTAREPFAGPMLPRVMQSFQPAFESQRPAMGFPAKLRIDFGGSRGRAISDERGVSSRTSLFHSTGGWNVSANDRH